MTVYTASDDDIAIVGMGVRFPDAPTLAEFRANLDAGRDSIGPMPEARAVATALDRSARYLPMGHLADIHTFDYAFFELSKREASLMDPQQRIALELAHRAIEDAGYAAATLREATTAVVFSAPMPSYHAMAVDPGPLSMLGNLPFGTTARIAHLLGLTGPCYAIDSGCNASLIAVHHACRELRSGDADYALAGGVSVRANGSPEWAARTMTEIASPSGVCRAFDADADGTVPGEGGAALLLTTLGRARADRAPVYAVIRGSAVLHNGHASATISTPSAAAQARVITTAWRRAGIDPRAAGYVEAHGSATRLGDAVELEGLRTVFGERPRPLPIGSVKTNIGHLDHAAGIAGLVKATLAVAEGRLYPSLHFERPTGDLDLPAAGLEVVTRARPWADGEPRLAGVSSYSLGGANAHCVVQQAPGAPVTTPPAESAPRLLAVSARTPAALAESCRDLAAALRDGTFSLPDVAFTLARGRTHFPHRVAVRATDIESAAAELSRRATNITPDQPRPTTPRVALLLSPGATPSGIAPATSPTEQPTLTMTSSVVPPADTPAAGPTVPPAGLSASSAAGPSVPPAEFSASSAAGPSVAPAEFSASSAAGPSVPPAELSASSVGSPVLPPAENPAAGAGSSAVLPAELPAEGEVGAVLAGQIAVHDRLRDCGLSFAAILSGGASKFAARYLLGSAVAADAGEIAAAAAAPAVDRSRLRAAAETLLREVPVVFVDPSADGLLGRYLAEDLAGHPDAEIVVGGEDSGEPLGILGRLYELGADLDWTRVDPGDGRRVRLPGHPLHGTRCWVELPTAARPAAPTTDPAAPSTPASPADPDEWLRAELRELLHSETEIASEDDYFDLGGNSIIAVQLVERVAETYGFRPKLLDVYERPKVADFAALLRDGAAPAAAAHAAALPPITRTDELVMSSGQERMWFHHQLVPDTTLYNYPVVNTLRGPVDVAAVRGTFEDFAERHEPLRYNLVEVDGKPAVRVRSSLGDFFRVVDVSGTPDPIAAARELIRDATQTPFDLARDPLVRVLLVTLAPDEHVLQVTCHHCVTDGATPGILAREIPELYAARRAGRAAALAPLPVRYRDYAAWHRELTESGALDHELRYWVHLLRDAPKLRLPTDFPRPPRKTFVGDLEPFTVPAELLARSRAVAKREAVSLFVVLLSALYLLLARRSGQRDLVIGTPTTGRTRREIEGLVGFFNSTVALRANLSGPATVADLLERVRAIVLGALEHQEIPFERVVNALGDQRDLSRTPLFDVLYVHQELPGMGNPLGPGATEVFDLDHSIQNAFGGLPAGTAKFDLSLITYDRSDEYDMLACFEYSTELFTRQTAAGFAAAYLETLAELVESAPGRSIDELVVIATAVPETIAVLDIPTDRPRTGSTAGYTPATVRERLDSTPGDAAVLGAWSALLAWYSGSDEVTVGLAAGTARLDLADEPDGAELLARTATALSTAAGADGDRPLRYRAAWSATTELALDLRSGGDGDIIELTYAAELFDDTTARDMLGDLLRVLRGLAETPGDPVPEITLRCLAGAEATR
ncbi:condensation domain-containing protein [Nocardia wallacei]|uniref:condensation domain-containing protein n=1 Tax=Nocardia wallacei TaxID=480035 RepID=UPI0024557A11|nr:condensation domain-containing protein [Nocardia wallacei]